MRPKTFWILVYFLSVALFIETISGASKDAFRSKRSNLDSNPVNSGNTNQINLKIPDLPKNIKPLPEPRIYAKVLLDLYTKKLKQEVFRSPWTKFQALHQYKNGQAKDNNGNFIDSFEELSSHPDKAKQYVLDLDERLPKQHILPSKTGNQWQTWFRKVEDGSKLMSLVDADMEVLKADIAEQRKLQLDIGSEGGKSRPWFLTNLEVDVTHLWFKVEGDVVLLMARRERTRIKLNTDINGYPSHFEGVDPLGPKHVYHHDTEIARYTKVDLNSNADRKLLLHKYLGITNRTPNGQVLNDQSHLFMSSKALTDAELAESVAQLQKDSALNNNGAKVKTGICKAPGARRKRALNSAGTGCAIFLSSSGEVEVIRPKEFVEAYKKANTQTRQELADIASNNRDKVAADIDANNLDSNSKMNQLVELESTKKHVRTITTIDDAFKSPSNKLTGKDRGLGGMKYLENIETKMGNLKNKVKLSFTKISDKLYRLGNSRGAKTFSNGVSIASAPLSAFFLAKTIVNGVKQGDATALGIVGGRVGYEVITNALEWGGTKYLAKVDKIAKVALHGKKAGKLGKVTKYLAGTKFFTHATKVGKVTKFLGKVAGPVSAVADIGLSAWSMSKSIERLKNATNKYDRDNAIADIVEDSIDIAVTATVTIVSIAFPPIAPIAIAVGIIVDVFTKITIGMFKAHNEVKRINAEVPLLDFEKQQIFQSRFFNWFGTRKPNYIDNLLDAKRANDLIVKHTLSFLVEHSEFRGIVFPSRTLYYDGACRLTKNYCPWKVACKWEGEETMQRGCDFNRPCSSTWGVCVDHDVKHRYGFNRFKCICDGHEKTSFGVPRANSVVNFERKQLVHWERDVPGEISNGEFKCKPGTTHFVDYKISQEQSRVEYLCENAIGLLQPTYRRKEGQLMLYDLDDGNDHVSIEKDTTPTLFRMGNSGTKYFYGGTGENSFLFDSNCNGPLRGNVFGGAGHQDSIVLGENCTRNDEITVNFTLNKIFSVTRNLDMTFGGIEVFNGRPQQTESVQVGCSTRRVATRGGLLGQPDTVIIPNENGCRHNVTVVGSKHTKISAMTKQGNLVILVENGSLGLEVYLDVPSSEDLKLTVIFLNATSSNIKDFWMHKENSIMKAGVVTSNDKVSFTFNMGHRVNDVSVVFPEKPEDSPYSILYLSGSKTSDVLFYHMLHENITGNLTRRGCKVIRNVFDISSHFASIFGGDKDDEFILNTANIGLIDGGGGVNTLKIEYDLSTKIVDLGRGNIRNIARVHGAVGKRLRLLTGCDTEQVVTAGGSKNKQDYVAIPMTHCNQRNLQVVAVGHCLVKLEGSERDGKNHINDTVNIMVGGDAKNNIKFQLISEAANTGNVFIGILVSHNNWSLVEASLNKAQNVILTKLEGHGKRGTETISLNLTMDSTMPGSLIQSPLIQIWVDNSSDLPGTLILDRDTGTPMVTFDLVSQKESNATGFTGIENIFRVASSKKAWKATGGNLDDEFLFYVTKSDGQRFEMDGGGGENTLIIFDDETESKLPLSVDLVKQSIGLLGTAQSQRGKIRNIQHIIGRSNVTELIYVACNTKSVIGRGGLNNGYGLDFVLIIDRACRYDLTLEVGNYTKVKSTVPRGVFTYNVQSLLTSEWELVTTKDNLHMLNLFHPWDVIKAVAFNETRQEMGWKLHNDRVQIFEMSRSRTSDDYDNPIFQFHPPGSGVLSEISVNNDGVTIATHMVHSIENPEIVQGLSVDLNRFVINITSNDNSDYQSGEIYGCDNPERCSANQFWIWNLNSSLAVLDGGKCAKMGTCRNYLHFLESLEGKNLSFFLNTTDGKVVTDTGDHVVSQLRNIHEFHGTKGTTAFVTCDTQQVSGVDKVVIPAGECSQDMIIGVEEYTTVWFEEDTESTKPYIEQDLVNDDDQEQTTLKTNSSDKADLENEDDEETVEEEEDMIKELGPRRTIHYRFTQPMNFELQGSYSDMLSHSHNYYLPFTLDALSAFSFNLEEDRIEYTIDGAEYHLAMISAPTYFQQFYSEPSIVTQDEYNVQVARDGTIWATNGNAFADSVEMSHLQEIANRLQLTLVVQSPVGFYYVGYSSAAEDRNVVQNIANVTSHLAGGGAIDTIYEILHLDKDVYLHWPRK